MASKTERVEARLSPDERKEIEQAATLEGQSLSSFIVTAASEKAVQVIANRTTTVVPSEYFDRLLSAIDRADRVPRLAKAANRARRRPRIN